MCPQGIRLSGSPKACGSCKFKGPNSFYTDERVEPGELERLNDLPRATRCQATAVLVLWGLALGCDPISAQVHSASLLTNSSVPLLLSAGK